VSLLHALHLPVVERQLEKGNDSLVHKLRSDRAAAHVWELLGAESNILACLHSADLVFSVFGLNGNDIVAAILVEPDIEIIDLDLTTPFTIVRRCRLLIATPSAREKVALVCVDFAKCTQNRRQSIIV